MCAHAERYYRKPLEERTNEALNELAQLNNDVWIAIDSIQKHLANCGGSAVNYMTKVLKEQVIADKRASYSRKRQEKGQQKEKKKMNRRTNVSLTEDARKDLELDQSATRTSGANKRPKQTKTESQRSNCGEEELLHFGALAAHSTNRLPRMAHINDPISYELRYL